MNYSYNMLSPHLQIYIVQDFFATVPNSDTPTIRAVLENINPPTTTPLTAPLPDRPSVDKFTFGIVCTVIAFAMERKPTAGQKMVQLLTKQLGAVSAN